jgi:hypothetical protein
VVAFLVAAYTDYNAAIVDVVGAHVLTSCDDNLRDGSASLLLSISLIVKTRRIAGKKQPSFDLGEAGA